MTRPRGRRLPASAAHLRGAVVEPADARSTVYVSAGAASSASAPRRPPPASSQATAGVAAEPAPAFLPLLRAVRLRVLRVQHGLEAISVARRARRDGEGERETGVSATRRSARADEEGACEIWWAGTHNAATRFTTLQKMSVMMLSRYGERRLTTAPSRTYGMAPRVSTAPRASDSGR